MNVIADVMLPQHVGEIPIRGIIILSMLNFSNDFHFEPLCTVVLCPDTLIAKAIPDWIEMYEWRI